MSTIPKVIHYCWFGGKDKPDLVIKCISSWREYLSDYKIVEWNETNFDVLCNDYCKEAFNAKKWAFITDYVRLYVLYNFGGIYMDTDVEVLKNFDDLLQNDAFIGFENYSQFQSALIGAKKNNKWIKFLLTYYHDRHFINDDFSFDMTPNVSIITNLSFQKYEIRLNNSLQKVENEFVVYPKDYFCPKDYVTGKIILTDNTYTIHHFAGSWLEEDYKKRLKYCKKIFGIWLGIKINSAITIFKREGFLIMIKKIINFVIPKLNVALKK